MTAGELAQRLEGRKSGKGWIARCPAHDDKHASLSISPGDDGRVLVKCHTGCEFSDVVRAANLEPKDLMPEADPYPITKPKPRIVAEYDYRDEKGQLLYQVVRLEPKSFRQRRPDGSGWAWSLGNVRQVPYRLPELIAAQSEPVFVVEGEKDADALAALGLVATTNSGGATKWGRHHAKFLEGREVCVLPDNDKAGEEHAAAVVATLPNARVVQLPGLPEKGDVSDWIANGGTKEQLLALTVEQGFATCASRMRAANATRLRNIPRVMPYQISYLDDELLGIHPNDIVVIMASTGAGKTTLGTLLAQRAARAGKRVAFFALEAYRGEIELRMLYRVITIMASEHGSYQPWMTQQKWIKQGIPELEKFEEPAIQYLEKHLNTLSTYYRSLKFDKGDVRREFLGQKGKADLIILDHLHYVDSDGPNENLELKNIIKTIRDCGQQLDIPVIVIAHVRKKGSGEKESALLSINDLHGTSDVVKMATAIISVAPARGEEFRSQDPDVANTFMAVLKDRIGGDKAMAGLMKFDLRQMTYRNSYRLCRRLPNGQVELAERKPAWAKHATGQV